MIQLLLCLTAIGLAGLALFVWQARPKNLINIWFSLYTAMLSAWTASIAGVHSGSHTEFWGSLAFAAASLAPAAFLIFGCYYPMPAVWLSDRLLALILVTGSLFATLSLGTRLVAHSFSVANGHLTRVPGPLYIAFAAYFVIAWASGAAVLIYKWRRARGLARSQLQYVTIGIIAANVLGITTNLVLPLLTGRSTYTWLGPLFGLLFIAVIAHAVIRHRAMDLRLVVHRSLTLAVATFASLAPVLAFAIIIRPRLADRFGPSELFGVLLALIVVSLLTPPTRDLANQVLDKYVHRIHTNYQHTLRHTSRQLTRILDLNRVVSFTARTVAAPTGAEAAAIYIARGGRFRRVSTEFRHQAAVFQAPDFLSPVLISALVNHPDVLLQDELLGTDDKTKQSTRRELAAMNWAVVLPLLCEDVVIGAIAVGPKLSGDPFYPEDIDLLMTLANQAGIAIKNAQLYTEVVLANEYIENIISTIESGVIAIDATGNIAMFNRTAEQLCDLESARVRGQSVTALPMAVADLLRQTLGDGQRRTQADIDLTAGSTTRPVLCTASPLRDPGGTALGAVAVFSDLTPLKQLENERRRAERLAYFEVLASSLAHEIKNPIVAIKTFTQLIPRRRDDDRFIDEFSRIVSREIDRIERLITRLRTLSRPSDRPKQPIDLRAPVHEAIEFMQPAFDEKRVGLQANLGSEPSIVVGDHAEIEELILNLLMNAREATPPDGVVTIDLVADGGSVSTFVADSGPGLPPDVMHKIFDPFFTTKQGGSGLGLTISSAIAIAHRANLRVANSSSGGALFIFELPLASPAGISAQR